MKFRFFTCDVFTRDRFGGNPLAVLPDARGLTDGQMQQIAREFNYSETTFVLPPEQGHTRKVRIFTPAREVPFAGHPNIGTAFILASLQEFGPIEGQLTVTFEEAAGLFARNGYHAGWRHCSATALRRRPPTTTGESPREWKWAAPAFWRPALKKETASLQPPGSGETA